MPPILRSFSPNNFCNFKRSRDVGSLGTVRPALYSAVSGTKHVTHNEALEVLDLLVQLVVQDFSAATPPALPQDGQVWALGPVPTGAWAGRGDMLAAWLENAWRFIAPQPGWRASAPVATPSGAAMRIWTADQWVLPHLISTIWPVSALARLRITPTGWRWPLMPRS